MGCVKKRVVNDKLIKVAFTDYWKKTSSFHPCCYFPTNLKKKITCVCARQSTPFLSAHISLLRLVSVQICGHLTERVWLLPQQADSTFVGWPLLFLASFSLPLSFSFLTCCFSSFSWAFFISLSLLLMVERSLWLETPSSWKTTHI